MTKLDLQQELLAKIKPGTKPSDLKKKRTISIPTPPTSPLMEPVKPNQEQTKTSDLQAQISSLQQQLQLYKDFREADVRIKEKLKGENEELKKTIEGLKNLSKTTGESEQKESKPPTFSCSSCAHTFNIEYIRLAKKSGKQICRSCTLLMLKRANQLSGLNIVLKVKKSSESQPTKTFTCQTCQQPQAGEPHLVHVTNYQEQGISPRQLAKVCSNCLNERVVLANFYCPRTSEGRDTWDPQEPQFDCDCPRGGKL